MVRIEEDWMIEPLAQAGDHSSNLAHAQKATLTFGRAVMTGVFNSRAVSVTAFKPTRSETLKWPIATCRRRALVSASPRVITSCPFSPLGPHSSQVFRSASLTRKRGSLSARAPLAAISLSWRWRCRFDASTQVTCVRMNAPICSIACRASGRTAANSCHT